MHLFTFINIVQQTQCISVIKTTAYTERWQTFKGNMEILKRLLNYKGLLIIWIALSFIT